MKQHLDGLRALCTDSQHEASPFRVKTRLERHLYAIVAASSEKAFGFAPSGLSEAHFQHFRRKLENGKWNSSPSAFQCMEVLKLAAAAYEKFSYLSDASNWSDDGQDPRIERCRDEILRLCDLLSPAPAQASATYPPSSRSHGAPASTLRS